MRGNKKIVFHARVCIKMCARVEVFRASTLLYETFCSLGSKLLRLKDLVVVIFLTVHLLKDLPCIKFTNLSTI